MHDLRLGCIRGNLEAVRITLAKGISVNEPLKGGWTALMYACSLAHPSLVDFLLQQGAHPNSHRELFTPLMAVCASTQDNEDKLVQCVDSLLRHGADVNTAEKHHISALMFAAKEGRIKVCRRLLSNTACSIDAQDSQGWTALFWGVNQGWTGVVRVLVQYGASPDITDSRGQTPLLLGVTKNLHQITDILTKKVDWPPEAVRDQKQKYVFGKGADSMLEALLHELAASVTNNNGGCGSNLARILNSMDFESNIEVLKAHGQAISKIGSLVNDCFRKSMIVNKFSPSPIVKQTSSLELSSKNTPYSAVEAREVLTHLIRHIEGLYASMSYVRLHMQGNPLVEDKNARIAEITALSNKALHHTRLLYDEIQFFHQYAKKLEGSDVVAPADVVSEQRTEPSHTGLISGCVVAAAVLVILFNTRVLTLSIFSQ